MWKSKLCAAIVLLSTAGAIQAGTIEGTVKATGLRDNAGAVVYVDAVAGKTFSPPTEHAKVSQKALTFIPHVLPVLVGTTVDFINEDSVTHNIFTVDACADKFNLGAWGRGEIKSHKFEKPCGAVLLCSIHTEMEGFVVAVPTPYFSLTDAEGAYAIKDLPDGHYAVKVWHPRLKEVKQDVIVSGDTKVDFELKKK
jgi:plastocyanin